MEGVWCKEQRCVERLFGGQLDEDIRRLHEIVGVFTDFDGHHADPHVALVVMPVLALLAE